jgi:hypothetical protein
MTYDNYGLPNSSTHIAEICVDLRRSMPGHGINGSAVWIHGSLIRNQWKTLSLDSMTSTGDGGGAGNYFRI